MYAKSVYKTCETIARTLMGKPVYIIIDNTFDGMAALNLVDYNITFNPNAIAKALQTAHPQGYSADVEESFHIFLVLHEIAHFIFSPTYEQLLAAIAKYPEIPDELQGLDSNIVEDSLIQPVMSKQYPSRVFKKAWATGTPIIQGAIAAKDYIQTLDPNNVEGVLFYFVLRAYNLKDENVRSMWNNNPKLPWSQKTLDLFDTTITIADKEDRVDKSCGELSQSIYNDLLKSNINPQKKNQGNNQGQGNGQGQGQGQGQGSNQSGQSNGQGQSPVPKEVMDKAIREAAANLNKQLNASPTKQQQANVSNAQGGTGIGKSGKGAANFDAKFDADSVQRRLQDLDAGMMGEYQVGVTTIDNLNYAGRMNDLGKQLYQIVAPIFARIHNEEPYWRYGLEEGDEIDQDSLTDFFINKDMHIYKDFIKPRDARKFNITFFLDDSGSMEKRFKNCANILTALAHGFEEAEIATQIYLFSSTIRKIKDLSTWSSLNGDVSDILGAIINSYEDGGTNIVQGLEYYLQQESFDDRECVNIVFILTDGSVNNSGRAAQLVREMLNRKVYVKGIGLELGYNIDWIPDSKDYTQSEILNNLGPEIADFLDDIIHGKA